MPGRLRHGAGVIVLLFILDAVPFAAVHGQAPSDSDDAIQQHRITQLIEDLGDSSYARRARARKELERMGLLAFDGLQAAQSHPNSEVASAARFLLGNLRVMWANETDALEVRELLSDYGLQSVVERESRMRRLATLPLANVFPALVRLCRFEFDQRLGREAALLLLGHEELCSVDNPLELSQSLRKTIGINTRPACEWLRALADEMESGKVDVKRWRRLIEDEEQRENQGVSRDIDPIQIFRLYQVTADRLAARGSIEAAKQLALDAVDAVPVRSQQIQDAAQWGSNHAFWDFILKLSDAHRNFFERNAKLQYHVAWAHHQLGDTELAAQLSLHALEMSPLKDTSAQDEMGPVDEFTLMSIDEHLRNGDFLLRSGLHRWAEKEFRYIIDRVPVWVAKSVEARFQLAATYQDQHRFAEAADVLEPLADRITRDGAFRKSLSRDRTFMYPEDYVLIHGYCRAMGFEQSDPRKAVTELMKLLPMDESRSDSLVDPAKRSDALIALYRLTKGDPLHQEVLRQIEQLVDQLNKEIREWEKTHGSEEYLIIRYNVYAWVVANTQGNFELALKRAEQVVKDQPNDAEYIDTLARCHFALGHRDEAIKLQRKALKLKPHSFSMRRQLDEFENSSG